MRRISVLALALAFVAATIFACAQAQAPSDKLGRIVVDLGNILDLGKRPTSLSSPGSFSIQGALQITFDDLDFGIQGKGAFVVYDPGSREFLLTRNGRFFEDGDGTLITQERYIIVAGESDVAKGEAKPIAATIARSFGGDRSPFFIALPADPETLAQIDASYYSCASFSKATDAKVLRGCVESFPVSLLDLIAAAETEVDAGSCSRADLESLAETIETILPKVLPYWDIEGRQTIDTISARILSKIKARLT